MEVEAAPDYAALAAALDEECALLESLERALEAERAALTGLDLRALRDCAQAKEALVLRLDAARVRRRGASGAPAPRSLRTLAASAPQELAQRLGGLLHRAADRAERVFLLNRGNGQLLAQGRAYIAQRMERLRYRGGRVVLYGRGRGYVSMGEAAIVQKEL